MGKKRVRSPDPSRAPDALFAARKTARKIPFAFILEALAERDPTTRLMFGTTAVYVDDKIVFALREKASGHADNGVWIATSEEHHDSLKRELPEIRDITVLGDGKTGWQVLPAETDGFEESALRACELVMAGDPRIGKVPKARRRRPKGAR